MPRRRNRTQINSQGSGTVSRRSFRIGFRKLEEWSDEDSYLLVIDVLDHLDDFCSVLNSPHLNPDWVAIIAKIFGKISSTVFPECRNVIVERVSTTNIFTEIDNFVQRRQSILTHSAYYADSEYLFSDLALLTHCVREANPNANFDHIVFFKRSQLSSANNSGRNSFRQMNVYPTPEEILHNKRETVYQNVINSKYSDVNHYLNVQFRLLREDFVAPLRQGVSAYLFGSKDTPNVIVHKNVNFICPIAGKDEIGVLVQFTKKKNKKKDAYRKRFMNGSLLCFTADNFRSLIFGRVVNGDEALLQKGQIAVGFENGFEIQLFDLTFTMVECLVFFEPYYRVLKALQCMKETCFPMKEYLVDVNPQAYNAAYIKTSTCYNIDGCNVSLTKPNTWPSSNHLRLNDSQRSAFIAALTHKFVVIQGPPGTGKTYLGLKIAETLVKNEHAWYDGSPILVVCLTNHALDQFLEGIVRVTDRVVRIGGQSKSEVLKQYSIREKRKNLAFKPHINKAWYNVKKNVRVYLDEVQELSDKLQSLSSYEDIICFSEFRNQYGNSWFSTASDEDILYWLFKSSGARERQLLLDKIENNDELTDDEDISDDSDDDDMLDEENPKEWQLDLGNDAIYNQRNFTKYLWSLRDLQLDIEKLEKQRNTNRNNKKLQELIEEQRFLKACLGNRRTMFEKVKPRNCNLNNPFTMSLEERWTLYFYWLEECRQVLVQKLVDVQSTYRAKFNQWLEIRDIEDIQTMKEIVVGMTTTGAARLQKTLMALRSPIVIVEEAAEVLEAHITVSLTKNCQHLILLGDHQQLRPSVADYNIEKEYNLGISLFERMVKNNITCHTLSVQHRMRPTIADLIVPAIYPRLQNASSVYDFPPIKGVAS